MNKDLPGSIAASYRGKLAKRIQQTDIPELAVAGSVPEIWEQEPGLSKENIDDIAEGSKQVLHSMIETVGTNKANLKRIVNKITEDGKEALKAVSEDNDKYLQNNPFKTSMLEVIVLTDGSRPSFMVRDGKVDKNSSPVGEWSQVLDDNQVEIEKAIACVGRINRSNVHIGTGFLIHPNLVITNRHVLQEIANLENDGNWVMKPGVMIDFGYEFRGRESVNPRAMKKIVFCGASYIDPEIIDHSKLDLALIELAPAENPAELPVLDFFASKDWADPGSFIYTIGYPGNPGLAGLKIYNTLLEDLFKSTFGYKRMAPGQVMPISSDRTTTGTVTHDATTLAGNSGSVIIRIGGKSKAAGLHYGGSLKAPRQNWGHILGATLEAKGFQGKTLRENLSEFNIKLTDTI
jgi:hypothetical protein